MKSHSIINILTAASEPFKSIYRLCLTVSHNFTQLFHIVFFATNRSMFCHCTNLPSTRGVESTVAYACTLPPGKLWATSQIIDMMRLMWGFKSIQALSSPHPAPSYKF